VVVVTLALAAACGGGQAANTPTVPAGTVLPGTTATPGGGGQTTAYTETKEVNITPANFCSIPVQLKSGDSLKIEVKVRSSAVGLGDTEGQNKADAGIIMAINDQLGVQILPPTSSDIEQKAEITADADGEHVIAFQNPFPLAMMIVTTTYSLN